MTQVDLTERAAQLMVSHVEQATQQESLKPLVEGVRQLLTEMGVSIGRIQIPMTKLGALRHPTYWGIMLTWNSDSAFEETFLVTHEQRAQQDLPSSLADIHVGSLAENLPKHSPYFDLLQSGQDALRINLAEDNLRHEILKTLRANGMVDYLALALPIPGVPLPQLMSVAATAPFPDDFEAQISRIKNILALSLFGACQASQSMALAKTYLGRKTGPRVLSGDIARGSSQEIEAGIMFCDIRGFTALSEHLGGSGMLPVMNALFEVIGEAATAQGGEILKFIGDAMLIVFRRDTRSDAEIASAMIDATDAATRGVQIVAESHALPLDAGFGCHIGKVLYGNIGTPDRLDFTVMGPAVNLTSRLEGLTKCVDSKAVFSQAVAKHVDTLTHAGDFEVKGITAPVALYIKPTNA
ncbi:MAG: adenylate/guanylate cyclase domain-containing protein [Myxococcota bacterium]